MVKGVPADYAKTVLAIGAHPDDIEYGCGGLLSRFAEKRGIVVTNGACGGGVDHRAAEMSASAAILGYRLKRLDMLDTDVALPRLIRVIEAAVLDINPAVVLTHWPDDSHQDHRAVAQAAMSALRGYRGAVLQFATPSTMNFLPTMFAELAPEEWEKKLLAINAHASQRARPYLQPESLAAAFAHWSGRYRGEACFVEPFAVVRAVI